MLLHCYSIACFGQGLMLTFSFAVYYMFQSLLTECVAPHIEEMDIITATASAGNPSYVCKMFR